MSKFKKAIKKKELESALAKHPLRELDEAVKNDYVKGLVFIAVEDENFSEDEKSYVTSIMKNIGVDEALLSEFETFANEPDEDELLEFMDRIKAFDEDLKVNFLIEVILLAFKDGDFGEAEQEMFNEYVEMLELEEKKDDIMHIATALENKDIDLALAMYTAKKDFFMKYDYMFDMIHVDIEKELNDVYSWEWVEFRLEKGEVEDNNFVASKPTNSRQICIFLNSLIINGNIIQIQNTNKFEYKPNKITIIEDINSTNINFQDTLFQYENNQADDFVGVNIDLVNIFVNWINEHTDNVTKGLKIIADSDSIVLSESAKGFLTDNYELFLAYIGYKSQGIKIRFIDISQSDYSYYNSKEKCSLKSNVNYAFRIMKVEEQ